MTRKFHFYFAELHIGSSIRYKNTLSGNYFLKCNKVKRIKYPSIDFLSIYDGGFGKGLLSYMITGSTSQRRLYISSVLTAIFLLSFFSSSRKQGL